MAFWSPKSDSTTPEREAAVGRLSALGDPVKPAISQPSANATSTAPVASVDPVTPATVTPSAAVSPSPVTPPPSPAASRGASPIAMVSDEAATREDTRAVFARALAEAVAEESRSTARIAELEQEIERAKAARAEASGLATSLRAYLERP